LIRNFRRYNKHEFKSPKQPDSPTTIHRAVDNDDDNEETDGIIIEGKSEESIIVETGESYSSIDLEIQTGEDKLDLFCKLVSDADKYF